MSELLPANTRIMHVVTDSHSVVAEVAKSAIQAQLDAGYRVAVAARESVFNALGVTGAQLRHIEIGAGAGLGLADTTSAFTLHKYYPHVQVVHAHGLHAAALAGAGLTGLPKRMHPVIVATIGRTGDMLASAQAKVVARTATAVLGTTEILVEEYRDTVPIVERARLLSDDVDTTVRPLKSRDYVRTSLDVPAGAWLVSTPVALVDSPALTTIAEVGSKLAQARPDRRWVFAFTGGGRSRSMVASGIVAPLAHMRMADEISTVDVLAASDVVVASDRMTVVDAHTLMQLGKPVVFVGSQDVARLYGTAAIAVEPGDVKEALHAVEAMVDQPATRASSGIHLRERVTSSHHGLVAEELLSIYAQALVLHES